MSIAGGNQYDSQVSHGGRSGGQKKRFANRFRSEPTPQPPDDVTVEASASELECPASHLWSVCQ